MNNSSDVIDSMYGNIDRLKSEIDLCDNMYSKTKSVWQQTTDESKPKVQKIMKYWQSRKQILLQALDADFLEKNNIL